MISSSMEFTSNLCQVVSEVAKLLDDCSKDIEQLEIAIANWAREGHGSNEIPIVELQRIDLLRQIQQDIVAILMSPELQTAMRNRDQDVDMASLLTTPNLELVRGRLAKLSTHELAVSVAKGAKEREQEDSGSLDLF